MKILKELARLDDNMILTQAYNIGVKDENGMSFRKPTILYKQLISDPATVMNPQIITTPYQIRTARVNKRVFVQFRTLPHVSEW